MKYIFRKEMWDIYMKKIWGKVNPYVTSLVNNNWVDEIDGCEAFFEENSNYGICEDYIVLKPYCEKIKE